jgi:hypothetical protein
MRARRARSKRKPALRLKSGGRSASEALYEQRRAETRAARSLAEAEAGEEVRLAELLAQSLVLEELGEESMSLLT